MVDWFRSHHGAPTDAKWRPVAVRAEQVLRSTAFQSVTECVSVSCSPGHVAAVWWAVEDYASQHEDRGSVDGFDPEVLAAAWDWDERLIRAIVEAFVDKKLILNKRLRNWEKRQPKREDYSTDRVRRHREKNETQENATQRNETQRNDRAEQSRVEIERGGKTPSQPPLTLEDENHKASRKRRVDGHRIPEDWEPTLKGIEYARARGLDPVVMAGRFKRHWLTEAGQKARKVDWDRAFETWCDKEVEYRGRQNGASHGRFAGGDAIPERRGPSAPPRPEDERDD